MAFERLIAAISDWLRLACGMICIGRVRKVDCTES